MGFAVRELDRRSECQYWPSSSSLILKAELLDGDSSGAGIWLDSLAPLLRLLVRACHSYSGRLPALQFRNRLIRDHQHVFDIVHTLRSGQTGSPSKEIR